MSSVVCQRCFANGLYILKAHDKIGIKNDVIDEVLVNLKLKKKLLQIV